jgi:hypothetical protein
MRVVPSGRGNTWCIMSSIYERFASASALPRDQRTSLREPSFIGSPMMDAEAQGEVGRSSHIPQPAFQAPEGR